MINLRNLIFINKKYKKKKIFIKKSKKSIYICNILLKNNFISYFICTDTIITIKLSNFNNATYNHFFNKKK